MASELRRCTIKGYLYGLLCGHLHVLDRVAEAEIFAVASTRNEPSAESLVADERAQDLKRVVRKVSEEELRRALAEARLVLRGKTEEDGSFCLIEPKYEGGLLDVYAAIGSVPLPKHERRRLPLKERQLLYLGTYAPLESQGERLLKLIIPVRVWCGLKLLADAWTIVGKVTTCDPPKVPISGVTVSAFDVDWTQQDALGSDVTDAAGIFRIDYPGVLFRQGTVIDVELFGGPDVYFKIVDGDGNPLLTESPSQGRAPGRADRGPCFCVDLCLKVPVPDGEQDPIVSVWTGVGIAFTIPDGGSLNDFDADGYAGAAKFAITGAPRMTGSAGRKTAAGNPIEYRFRVSETTGVNGNPPLAAASFTHIVGVGSDAGLFAPTKVAQMIRFLPTFKIIDIVAQVTDLDADGWFDVNKAIERTFVERLDVDPVDIPDFLYVDSDGLMAINTAPLVPAHALAALAPGVAVPPGDRIPVEKLAVRFELREVIDKPNGIFGAMPGDGTTLNAMVVNNDPAYMRLAMKEHLESTPCAILTGSIHVAYTVHHPHLRNVSLGIVSNDGSYNVSLSDGFIPLAGNTNAAIVHQNNPALAVPNGPFPTPVLHKCTYLVTLGVLTRLHNGDGSVATQVAQTTFFYDV